MKDFRTLGNPAAVAHAAAPAGDDPARSAAATRALVGRILQASGLCFVAVGVYLMVAAPSTLPGFISGIAAPLLIAAGFVEFGVGRAFTRLGQRAAGA